MISTGIVVEYNPFHNGHALHLQMTKESTQPDIVIAVMSGNFLQRGEPALVSKFARTKMALDAGVDIVVELPYSFSTQKAEIFAKGAVEILSSLDCDYLCFGSESGSIENFQDTIQFMVTNQKELDYWIHYFMQQGESYPKANSLAFHKLVGHSAILDLSQPNNILGYHYMKAINELKTSMKGVTIQRENSGYHDPELSPTNISSATSIRKAMFKQNASIEEIKNSIPETTYSQLKDFKNEFHTFVNWENYWPLLKYRLLQSDPEELHEVYEMEEGLEFRLIHYAKEAESFQAFMEQIKTKRYTWTRLQRVCTHVLTNTKKIDMLERSEKPEYVRLLGTNSKGRNYLKQKKENFTLPIIAKLSSTGEQLVRLDVKAGQVYSFGFPQKVSHKLLKADFTQPPIIID